jgi:hypothetical protein
VRRGFRSLLRWWSLLPESFSVARGRDGEVAGFACMFNPATVRLAHLQSDPVTSAWCLRIASAGYERG